MISPFELEFELLRKISHTTNSNKIMVEFSGENLKLSSLTIALIVPECFVAGWGEIRASSFISKKKFYE
jgi:hypothetical protein